MQFNPDNPVIKICAEGMNLEGAGKPEEALYLFRKAWQQSGNDFEKFTSAHYLARHQNSVVEKLEWDLLALKHAQKMEDPSVKEVFPSLYLNIGKDYEDLNNLPLALENYHLAFSFSGFLPDDGYGRMIRLGIENGIRRVSSTCNL